MLVDQEVIAFIATADPESARQFYEGVLGLRLLEDSPFALVFEAGSIVLRIQKLASFTPVAHTVLGWRVSDISTIIEGLASKGVRFERFEGMTQDELGVWASPSGAKIAWFKDPAGNILSLTQT
jgi:catechol 2,3-dioxygenase-like lactoylglutathione lyase family enzyme